jgi:magnesium transporter
VTQPANPATRERGVPLSAYLRPDGQVEWNQRPGRLKEAMHEGGQLWVDIDTNDRAQHALLEKLFGFHHLAIEDTLSPRTRVKLEEYGSYLFLVVRSSRLDHRTDDPYDIETVNLYLFLAQNYLVTVHGSPARAVEEMQHRLERGPDLLQRGVEMIAHGIVDHTVDEFLPMVDQVDEMVDRLEERLFEAYDDEAIKDIFAIKRLVVQLRRHLGPLREVLNILTNRPQPCINPASQIYFRDVYDHTIRVVESLESIRDLVASVLDTYLTQASNRMNKVMKALSVVTTISLPLVVVGGIFGMNFGSIPMTHSPFGFYWALAIMAMLAFVLWWFLRRQRWV